MVVRCVPVVRALAIGLRRFITPSPFNLRLFAFERLCDPVIFSAVTYNLASLDAWADNGRRLPFSPFPALNIDCAHSRGSGSVMA